DAERGKDHVERERHLHLCARGEQRIHPVDPSLVTGAARTAAAGATAVAGAARVPAQAGSSDGPVQAADGVTRFRASACAATPVCSPRGVRDSPTAALAPVLPCPVAWMP